MDQEVVHGFDQVNIITRVLQSGARSGPEIRQYILTTKRFAGAGGEIEFTENGDCRRPMEVRRVRAGECVAERS